MITRRRMMMAQLSDPYLLWLGDVGGVDNEQTHSYYEGLLDTYDKNQSILGIRNFNDFMFVCMCRFAGTSEISWPNFRSKIKPYYTEYLKEKNISDTYENYLECLKTLYFVIGDDGDIPPANAVKESLSPNDEEVKGFDQFLKSSGLQDSAGVLGSWTLDTDVTYADVVSYSTKNHIPINPTTFRQLMIERFCEKSKEVMSWEVISWCTPENIEKMIEWSGRPACGMTPVASMVNTLFMYMYTSGSSDFTEAIVKAAFGVS